MKDDNCKTGLSDYHKMTYSREKLLSQENLKQVLVYIVALKNFDQKQV